MATLAFLLYVMLQFRPLYLGYKPVGAPARMISMSLQQFESAGFDWYQHRAALATTTFTHLSKDHSMGATFTNVGKDHLLPRNNTMRNGLVRFVA